MDKVYDYLVIEGAGTIGNSIDINADKSETVFWKVACSCYFNNRVIVIPVGGVYSIPHAVMNIVSKNEKCRVHILIDWFGYDTQVSYVRDGLSKFIDTGLKDKQMLYIYEGYTFEWMLLSIPQMVDLIYSVSSQRLNVDFIRKIKYIQRELINNIEHRHIWYDELNSKAKGYLSDLNISVDIPLSFEKLCYLLIERITRSTGYHVSKKRIGECWYTDCKDEDKCYLLSRFKSIDRIPNRIYKCSDIYLGKTTKPSAYSKLEFIFRESIAIKGIAQQILDISMHML